MRTFKTKLLLSKEQREYFDKAFGIRRWTWNWSVATYFEAAKSEPKKHPPTAFDLQKILNNTLVLQEEYAWLREVNSMVRQEAFKDFGLAIKAWHKAQAASRRSVEPIDCEVGKPRFKKKGKCPDSCRYSCRGDPVRYVSPHHFKMTRMAGYEPFILQTVEKVTCLKGVAIRTTTVSREHGSYYVAFTFEKTNRNARPKGVGTVGIDLGVHHAAAIYDGTNAKIFDLPETLAKAEHMIAECNRLYALKPDKRSKRAILAKIRLQKAYAYAANIRKDFLHKLTTWLVSSYDTIKVDDFSFKAFVRMQASNHPYSGRSRAANHKAYSVSPYAFKQMLEYKAAERGVSLQYVPKGTPTSKTCAACGSVVSELKLKDRMFICPHCGHTVDRDINGAMNAFGI